MVRASAQLNSLPGRLSLVVQAMVQTARRAAPRVLAILLLWNIALHAPFCCIVHCHVAPWLMTRTSSHQKPSFTCTFNVDTNSSLPPVSALPPVFYPAILTLPIVLIVLLTAVGWLMSVSYTFSRNLAPPPTPPPRSA